MPADELESAEATLQVLQQVLQGVTADQWSLQTPCREYDVAKLTDHLMNSINIIGGAADAQLPDRDSTAPVERQVMDAARAAVDAWHRRGLGGSVPFGQGEAPAAMMAGIMSLEFLVHAWDYAVATGTTVTAPDDLAEYVLGLAEGVITPQARSGAGFDEPVDIPSDASALDRLVAFTGRRPGDQA